MARIIINYDENKIADCAAVEMVTKVIALGLISKQRYGKTYCGATTFGNNIIILANKTKTGTHVFHIIKESISTD